MSEPIQSAGGIVYHLQDGEPKFLILKRHTFSKKIERIPPKGKIQQGEAIEVAALREVSEETGIPIKNLLLKQKIGQTHLRKTPQQNLLDKDITYFLIEYKGNPKEVNIASVEGYLGIYKWATIYEIMTLVHYKNLREIFRETLGFLQTDKTKQNFINKLS